MLHTAVRLFVHDRAKCVIAIVGVAFAVTLVVVQVGLFRGLLANSTVTIEEADADLWITSKNTPNVDFPHYFPDAYVDRVRSIAGVARADNLIVAYVGMQLPNGAEETVLVYGLDEPTAWHLPWAVAGGSIADLRRGAVMVLDDSATRRFGPFDVGDHRELFGHRLEIIAKTRGALSFTTMPIAFTSLRVAQELQPGFDGRTAYVLVKLAPGARAADVEGEIRRRLPYNDVLTRPTWATKTRDYWVVSTGLGMNMGLTVFLGVLIGTTIVAQTLYAATLDRTREFGALKAIGATSGHVMALVATQAVLAALLGLACAVPAVLALRALARTVGLAIVVTWPQAGAVVVGTVAMCLASSLVTFRRLAKIDPALVFRG